MEVVGVVFRGDCRLQSLVTEGSGAMKGFQPSIRTIKGKHAQEFLIIFDKSLIDHTGPEYNYILRLHYKANMKKA